MLSDAIVYVSPMDISGFWDRIYNRNVIVIHIACIRFGDCVIGYHYENHVSGSVPFIMRHHPIQPDHPTTSRSKSHACDTPFLALYTPLRIPRFLIRVAPVQTQKPALQTCRLEQL